MVDAARVRHLRDILGVGMETARQCALGEELLARVTAARTANNPGALFDVVEVIIKDLYPVNLIKGK